MKPNRLPFWLARCLLVVAAAAGIHPIQALDIPVVNNNDSGNGTLRQAIQYNESMGGGNTIVFSNIVTGTITLSSPLGELLITKDVTIIGPGAKVLAISGNNAHRVFHLTNNAAVSISGLTITNGSLNSGAEFGGGVLQDSGVLALSECAISGNINNMGSGGGIGAFGTVRATRCTISGNFAAFQGGGVLAVGTFSAINCTIFTNIGIYGGGGINSGSPGVLFLTNCTISGNLCGFNGGGGIWNDNGNATTRNTIIAGNRAEHGLDCYGAFTSAGFNLIGAIDGSTGWGALGDQVGTTNSPLNAWLGPLQDNGGPTLTMEPLFYSPAIDQGNSSGSLTDQRGRPRLYTNDYGGSIPLGGDHSDIGAYEISPATLVVSNLNDSGSGSLREAIASAFPTENDIIRFGSNVAGTLTLTTGELVIGKVLTIVGPTTVPITVSGNNASRVLHITNNGAATIYNLTIANGNSPAQGAGIYNDFGGELRLNNCAVVANLSGANGGGVANNGAFFAYNCTFTSNRAAFTGGAIYTYAGPVYLQHSTVVSNSTVNADGGGICNYSLAPGTSDYITSSLVAGNSAPGHADVIGVFISGGYNLIGKIDYTTPGGGAAADVPTSGLTNGVNHDLVGSVGSPIDPKIGRLQNNGGPTPTMALLSNSPAIDKGINSISAGLTTDQRGAPRTFDFASIANAGGGDGSDIGAFELGSPTLNIQKFTTNAVLSWQSYYGDFTLQSVTNVILSNGWTPVAGTPVVSGNQYVFTNGPITGSKFYRLKGN